MRRSWILTTFLVCGLTAGQPLNNGPVKSDSPSITPQKMLDLMRSSMEKSVHTYGMNLSSDVGYVWNNLGRRPILHDVGKPEEETTKRNAEKGEENGKKPPQILEELFNYEEFWHWLSDWTTAYMQALSDYLTKTIREEVAKEVEMYFNILETGDYIQKMNKINSDRIRDQLYLEVKHKLIVEGLISDGSPAYEAPNASLKKDVAELVHQEIEQLKKRKDKDEKKPNKESEKKYPNRIEADKIYGNSIGNEKVINIYVFNPNKDTKEVIEELKPVTEGVENGTYTFGEQENIIINGGEKETGSPVEEILETEANGNDDSEVLEVKDK